MYINKESDLYLPLITRGSKRNNREMTPREVDEFRENISMAIGNKSILANWSQFIKSLKRGMSFKIQHPYEFLQLVGVLEDTIRGELIITVKEDDKVINLIAYYVIDGFFYDTFFNRLVRVDKVIQVKPFDGGN